MCLATKTKKEKRFDFNTLFVTAYHVWFEVASKSGSMDKSKETKTKTDFICNVCEADRVNERNESLQSYAHTHKHTRPYRHCEV